MDKRGEGKIYLKEFKEALLERWDALGDASKATLSSVSGQGVSVLTPLGIEWCACTAVGVDVFSCVRFLTVFCQHETLDDLQSRNAHHPFVPHSSTFSARRPQPLSHSLSTQTATCATCTVR